MGYRIAVVGATGNVGREMLNILAERQFPVDEVAALASARSTGDMIEFGESGEQLKVKNLEHFDFAGWDMALFAAGFSGYARKNIIANPNCSTAQLVVALKPLHDAAKIRRVVVSTYQSVSGSGKGGMDELFEQSRNIFVGDPSQPSHFTKQIAFNVIPHIDVFLDDGSTKEEWKMVVETKKILDPSIKVTATCVRVPVFVGHSEAVNVELERELSADQARDILREAPGLMVVDKREDGGYVTPVECVGDYATFVSRLRDDPTVEHGLSMWVVSDNLRKGAALNAVQIAELLGRKHLKKAA